MLVFPEEEAPESGGEVRVEVLPWKEKGPRDSWLGRLGLREPILFGLVSACALAVAFLLVGQLQLFLPEIHITDGATMVLGIAVALVALLPLTTALSAIVVWILVGRRGKRLGADFARSVVAVTAGVSTVVLAGFLAFPLRLLLGSDVPAALDWTFSIAGDAIAGVCVGWVTVRLSPSAPYRHALAVGLVLVVGVLFFVLVNYVGSGSPSPWALLVLGVYLLFLPVLLLGAWIGVRRRPALPR